MHLKHEIIGSVHLLDMCNGDQDNVINDEVIAAFNAALDHIESHNGNTALLLTARHPKTFCTGIDLAWLATLDKTHARAFVSRLEQLLLRLALFPMPVVAAINGNAYAGGAMLAIAADYRLMRTDRGRFCLPEVKIAKAFTSTMIEVIRLLHDRAALWELATTAAAWDGPRCLQGRVVDELATQDQLLARAIDKATSLSLLERKTYTRVKRDLRAELLPLWHDAAHS